MLTYLQAIILGLLQGITELFPVSSLGHTVIFPALFGWNNLVKAQASTHHTFFLAFIVALHVGTALALLFYFRTEWVRIIRAFFATIPKRRIETPTERLAWLLVIATIPAGLMGLLFEKLFRTLFAHPIAASLFLVANGVMLLVGDRSRVAALKRQRAKHRRGAEVASTAASRRLDTLEFKEAVVIGVAQVLALFAGISRSGVTMVAGLVRGLDHEDSAKFSFLLAAPIILAAGIYKLPTLMGPAGHGVRGQALVGGVSAAVAAYLSTRFLMKYFETNRLWPFAAYSIAFGAAMVIRFSLF